MKRLFASLMAAVMLLTTTMTGVISVGAAETTSDAEKYVTLDGEWHYKLYRTYTRMFQYFPYGMVEIKWEDNEAAVYPSADAWKSWDVKQMPADDETTGGLLTNEFVPMWSESWFVRTFDLPKDFTEEETVTLLMGIIDDNDVIYINGTPVASSGFMDGDGLEIVNKSPTGGFNYNAETPAAQQIKWTKSYWEVQREYTIPADLLKQGETNEIAVRLYNNNSNGGFYAGQVYAICGNESAVRELKGLPSTRVESPEVMKAVAAQNEAILKGDLEAYAATISPNYHNDDAGLADKLAQAKVLMDAYQNGGTITDENAAVYMDKEGFYWYVADRTITDGRKGDGYPVNLCFAVSDGVALERGNWNRCYGTSYQSELFYQNLTYSVYLPPSYYTSPNRYYPVVWLLHGQNSSSTSYRDVDKIGAFMDDLIAKGEVTEMVLIMPDSGKNAFYRDSEIPTDGNINEGGPWRTQLTQELRGVAQDNYRIFADAEFNGLTGNSMGAYGSLCAGTTNPDLYSSIGLHMGYLPEDAQNDLKSLTIEQLDQYDFYLDCGLQDQTVGTKGTIAVHEYLESVGKEHGYSLRDGTHNSAFYMSGMPASMKMHSDHFLANGVEKMSAENRFTDVTVTDWYYGAVNFALRTRMMAGVSADQFAPNVTLSRGMIVQMLWAYAGKPACDSELTFTDVDENDWYAEAVCWAAANGITAGYEDHRFGGEDSVTREQLAVMLYNYGRVLGADMGGKGELSFTDAGTASRYAIPALKWAVGNGIISGRGNGILAPNGTATRAEAAQMMMKFQASLDI